MAEHGLSIQRAHVIRDEPEEIRRCFKTVWPQADLIITTGGLGPTCDDNTRETIAETLGLELVHDPETEAAIRTRLAQHGQIVPENSLRQAKIPAGAQPLANTYGTAPGLWLQHAGKYLIMLPGPHVELQPMFEQAVLPRLHQAGLTQNRTGYLQLSVTGQGESKVAATLQPLFAPYGKALQVAYCAHAGMIDIRLNALSTGELDQTQIQAIGEACRKQLGADFVGYGEINLARTVLGQLYRHNKTLAVAESCTGGLLASTLTDEPGASASFSGGIICYAKATKKEQLGIPASLIQQQGVVSAACAKALAVAAATRFHTDYALSITGVAGPGGGTTEYPVGTIFIGCYTPEGPNVERINVAGQRQSIKRRAVNAALDRLRRYLTKN